MPTLALKKSVSNPKLFLWFLQDIFGFSPKVSSFVNRICELYLSLSRL